MEVEVLELEVKISSFLSSLVFLYITVDTRQFSGVKGGNAMSQACLLHVVVLSIKINSNCDRSRSQPQLLQFPADSYKMLTYFCLIHGWSLKDINLPTLNNSDHSCFSKPFKNISVTDLGRHLKMQLETAMVVIMAGFHRALLPSL